MTDSLLASLIFLSCNIFFVLAEFSLVRTQTARLEVMKSQGRKRASLVLKMLKRLDHYLSAIQIGVTMSTLGLGWTGEPAVSRLLINVIHLPPWLSSYALPISTALAFLIIIYFQIVFAELVPRSIAINKAEKLALWIAPPLEIYYLIFRLPTYFLSKSAIMVGRLLGLSPVGEHEQVFSEEEMRILLGTSQEKGLLPLDRLLLIENLFDLGSLRVRDAMVWRDKIVYLSTANKWEENLRTLKTHHFSRYPIANPNLDHVAGIAHIKDLVMLDAPADLMKIKRKVRTVQDSELLQPLLKTMATEGTHMVLCVKAGRVTGLLTLEDVLEEIVGEIHDEFDARDAWSLHQFLSPAVIDLSLKSSTPREAIHSLASRVKTFLPDIKIELVEKVVNLRESQLPTAIGKGAAVPHARLPNLKNSIVAIGRAVKPISFATPDKIPVRLVFLILTPASAPIEQLRILSRVAALLKNDTIRRQLLSAKTSDELFEAIRSSEGLIAG